MHWTGLVVIILSGANTTWMIYDGARALTIGDYVTPSGGTHAGQLGIWSKLIESIGINPRSTLMKLIFVSYGVITLVIIGCFILGLQWSWWGMAIMAVLGGWYLPFGMMVNIIILILLWLPYL